MEIPVIAVNASGHAYSLWLRQRNWCVWGAASKWLYLKKYQTMSPLQFRLHSHSILKLFLNTKTILS